MDALLVQLGDAPLQQLEVRGGCREARMRACVQALHLAGQLREAQQQLGLGLLLRAADLAGDARQVALGMHQRPAHLARHRQAEQRAHAVGLDLQQPLHRAPQAPRAHLAGRGEDEPRMAVGMQAEVGVDLAQLVHHLGGHQAVFVERLAHQLLHRVVGAAADDHVQAHQPLPGQRMQPVLRHFVQRLGVEALGLVAQRAPEGVGLELGVALPAQSQAPAQLDAQVAGIRRGQRQQTRAQQRIEVCARGAIGRGQHGDVRQR